MAGDRARLFQHQALEEQLSALSPGRWSSSYLGLERIRLLLEEVGNPQEAFQSIHVTGTAGKTSTSAIAASILSAAGYRTGLFTSPHLQVLNECFVIDGKMQPTDRLAAVLDTLMPHIARVGSAGFGPVSSFEAQVSMALLLFAQQGIQAAVIEVGVGGRLDATNAVRGDVALLTNVGMDHADLLGDTVEAIAIEKIQIIKAGSTAVSGATQPGVRQLVRQRCEEVGANLLELERGSEYQIHSPTCTVALPGGRQVVLRPSLRGDHQLDNAAAAALAACAFDPSIPEAAVEAGAHRAWLPGRLELVQSHPSVVLDGAHNVDKLRASLCAAELAFRCSGSRRVVFALKEDKDAQTMLDLLSHWADHVILTTFTDQPLWASIDPHVLAASLERLDNRTLIDVDPEPRHALRRALDVSGVDDLILVTGSLYLVGQIREHWQWSSDILTAASSAPIA